MPINLNNPPQVALTPQQISQLQAFEAAGQYADGYRYLRDIVNPPNGSGVGVPGTGGLATWLDKAASINSNDGSKVSDAVRGSTKGYGDANGNPISDSKFQDASDSLAKEVFKEIYDRGGVPPLKDIIKTDVQNAVEKLGLERWQWAGTWGDQLPVPLGLGEDYQSYPEEWDVYEKARQAARSFGNGLKEYIKDLFDGGRNWFERRDPLTLDLARVGRNSLRIAPYENVTTFKYVS